MESLADLAGADYEKQEFEILASIKGTIYVIFHTLLNSSFGPVRDGLFPLSIDALYNC